jgi:hypothetical protein
VDHPVVLQNFSGAKRRNDSSKFNSVVVAMGSRMLWHELPVDADYLCELVPAGEGGRIPKSPKRSAETSGFTGQTAETFVKFTDAGNGFDFFR